MDDEWKDRSCSRVDVVDADELVLDEDLAFLDLRHRDILLVLQNLRPTSLLDPHSLHRLG